MIGEAPRWTDWRTGSPPVGLFGPVETQTVIGAGGPEAIRYRWGRLAHEAELLSLISNTSLRIIHRDGPVREDRT